MTEPSSGRAGHRPDAPAKGLPGGIALPAVVFVIGFATFAICWRNPGLIDLGPSLNPAGIGVLVAAASFLWLLVAIAKRPPPAG